MADPPALAIIELASLARAGVVLDAIVKRSPVTIRRAERVSPGKFSIVIGGGVAEVDEGFGAGLEAAAGTLVDRLFLPQAHRHILASVAAKLDRLAVEDVDSLGLFETYTASAALASLDAALKATDVDLAGVHLCAGIGGKGYWVVSGPLHLIDEAVDVARTRVARDKVVMGEVIARPHDEAVEAYLAAFGG